MKLGFLTACLPDQDLAAIIEWAGGAGYQALEVAAWPALGDRPFTATHIAVESLTADRADTIRHQFDAAGLTLSSLAFYDNNLHPDPAERAAINEHVRACISAAALLGCPTVGTFVGRNPSLSVADNLAEAEQVFAPLVDYAGEQGVKIIVENCVMEGWHPDGYPGNLAYSPELWEWMFSIGLYLNYDPSHLVWMGIDPVTALRPYVDRIPHAQAKDIQLFPELRNRYGWPGKAISRDDPWGRRLVALPRTRPRRDRLEAHRRHALRGRVRWRAVGRARRSRMGWDRGAHQDGASRRAPHAHAVHRPLTPSRERMSETPKETL